MGPRRKPKGFLSTPSVVPARSGPRSEVVAAAAIGGGRRRLRIGHGHRAHEIADRGHIIFGYLERETSSAIYARFRGPGSTSNTRHTALSQSLALRRLS